jgi:aminopeptidase N
MAYHRTFIATLLLILALTAQSAHGAEPGIREYDLDVSFDIPRSKIIGLARVRASGGERLQFQIDRLAIQSVSLRGKPAPYAARDGTLNIVAAESGTVEIRYERVFQRSAAPSRSADADIPDAISREGIFLASAWYPRISYPANFHLTAALPKGYVAISEAESIRKVNGRGGTAFSFQFNHPANEITFVANDRYQTIRERFHGIELSAYFFPEDVGLARRYLDFAKKYIRLYEGMLTPFPFKRFAIVENFLPTGYSMPTYTLLGQAVVRLPFIVETSLGHEILHQWLGNYVYGGAGGNWTEGLTTYLADYFYDEQKGEGARYRRQILVDYQSYVGGANDFPLSEFTSRFDAASRAIGYGKSAMVFHMLRRRVGDNAFFNALKRVIREKHFRRATWKDFADAFQKESGQKLGWYFQQWLQRKGLPELRIDNLTVERGQGAFVIAFDLGQKGEIYRLDVPVKVLYLSGGEKNVTVPLEQRSKRVRIELERDPREMIVDENFDVARELSNPEIPPVVASLIGAEKPLVLAPASDNNIYKDIVDSLRAKGDTVKDGEMPSDAELRSSTLVVLGGDHPALRRLFGKIDMPNHGFDLVVKKHPWNPGKTLGVISARSADEVAAAYPKIFHYGKYSQLAFEHGRNVVATVAASERGMRRILNSDPPVIEPASLKSLSRELDQLAGKKIVYVGEEHDKLSHHQVQLEVLRALYRQNPKIAVGMEMFQAPSQKALDDYISGAIDERAFLKQSEYFKNWNLDYHYYKPILDFAREKRLPVIALNARREIVAQVASGGLQSLSEKDREDIPPQLDFSDQEYRARLKKVFAAHRGSQEKNFDYFYQAQLVWDETMAESIDRFLKKNPESRMLVLTGNGHLEYGAGIPKRSFRRNGYDYAIVLNDGEVKKDIADFIAFPEAMEGPSTPRLMVLLDDRNQSVRVAEFAKNSVAEKAGMKVGDVILALDGHPVTGVDDIRIALFYKRPGENIEVKAKRGDIELEFNVKLAPSSPSDQ